MPGVGKLGRQLSLVINMKLSAHSESICGCLRLDLPLNQTLLTMNMSPIAAPVMLPNRIMKPMTPEFKPAERIGKREQDLGASYKLIQWSSL